MSVWPWPPPATPGYSRNRGGGRGTLNRIFEDQGNQMLMQAALWDISRSGPKSFTLRDWFTATPEERTWKST